MENILLGICECVKDWHGKFDKKSFSMNGTLFVIEEKIMSKKQFPEVDFFLDRHRHFAQFNPQYCGFYETIVFPRLEFIPDEICVELLSPTIPTIPTVIEKLKSILRKIIKHRDLKEFLIR